MFGKVWMLQFIHCKLSILYNGKNAANMRNNSSLKLINLEIAASFKKSGGGNGQIHQIHLDCLSLLHERSQQFSSTIAYKVLETK